MLCDEYQEVDDDVFWIEQNLDAASDRIVQEQKLRRVRLKHRIAERLRLESGQEP